MMGPRVRAAALILSMAALGLPMGGAEAGVGVHESTCVGILWNGRVGQFGGEVDECVFYNFGGFGMDGVGAGWFAGAFVGYVDGNLHYFGNARIQVLDMQGNVLVECYFSSALPCAGPFSWNVPGPSPWVGTPPDISSQPLICRTELIEPVYGLEAMFPVSFGCGSDATSWTPE
ncbi:MAG: hypothetical protein HY775_02030 [Acidobacteria bacterium]|nr:hypothetical protein [Acidobacteriota bacterium]